MSAIKLISDGTPAGTKLFVHGEQVPGVRCVTYEIDADSVGRLIVEFISVDIEIEVEGHAG